MYHCIAFEAHLATPTETAHSDFEVLCPEQNGWASCQLKVPCVAIMGSGPHVNHTNKSICYFVPVLYLSQLSFQVVTAVIKFLYLILRITVQFTIQKHRFLLNHKNR